MVRGASRFRAVVRRVFTRQHFGYMLRALTEKLKLGGGAGAMIQGGRGKDYVAEIELLRKDGASLDALTECGVEEIVLVVGYWHWMIR